MEVRRLVWDQQNVEHIGRHGVTSIEVEEVCHGSVLTFEAKKGRMMAIGLTNGKRMLSVVLAPYESAGVFYVVTARASSKKEKRRYDRLMGGTDEAA